MVYQFHVTTKRTINLPIKKCETIPVQLTRKISLANPLKYQPITAAATLTDFSELGIDYVHRLTYKSKMAAMMRIIPWRK